MLTNHQFNVAVVKQVRDYIASVRGTTVVSEIPDLDG